MFEALCSVVRVRDRYIHWNSLRDSSQAHNDYFGLNQSPNPGPNLFTTSGMVDIFNALLL